MTKTYCRLSGLREYLVRWNRITASHLVLSLFPGFSHVGGDLRRVPQSEWLESVAQKFRIFGAVVSKPAIPKRIGAHTVVRDPIAGVGDDVFDGLAGPQVHARTKQLLRGNGRLIGLLVFARRASEPLAHNQILDGDAAIGQALFITAQNFPGLFEFRGVAGEIVRLGE